MGISTNSLKTINEEKYSPSNINTGRNQKYYGAIEYDGKLNLFIEIFKTNGNNWEMDNNTFENILNNEKNKYNKLMPGYEYVHKNALEIINGKVKLKSYTIDHLIKCNKSFSIKNTLKQTKKTLANALDRENILPRK
ncbi:MAG: hypothetical protein NTY80_02870 [candidate division SR1 bacterium]|nr:hypothetical protein [candidate division SR1 bacterium]